MARDELSGAMARVCDECCRWSPLVTEAAPTYRCDACPLMDILDLFDDAAKEAGRSES